MGKIYLNEEQYGGTNQAVLQEFDYAYLNSYGFTIPITVSYNHKVEVTYKADAYANNMAITGNNGGGNAWGWYNLVMYNNHLYGTNGDLADTNFTDKHTYIYNDNGYDYLDGVQKFSSYFNPTAPSSSTYYQIGDRYNITKYKGRIYKFKITDITNNTVICDIVPVKLIVLGVVVKAGLFDKISGEFYENEKITVGNE